MPLTLSRDALVAPSDMPVRGPKATVLGPTDGGRTAGHVLGRLDPRRAGLETPGNRMVDEWGIQSFPASDPPANW